MAGDVDLQILNDMEFGRAYFERDGYLDANDRSKFCPADVKRVVRTPIMVLGDTQIRYIDLPVDTYQKLHAWGEEIRLQEENTRLLIENQRLHARRFRMNRKYYRARVSAA